MEDSKGLYLYGIVSAGREAVSGKGVDPEASVRSFSYRDIAALVSEVTLSEFGEDALKENLKNLEWVKEKIWAHEKVLEEAMEGGGVVPLKFGTIFLVEERLKKVLRDSYEAFSGLLVRLQGQSEWALKIYGDLRILKETVERNNARVEQARNEMRGKAAGVAYLLQKKLERTLSEEAAAEKGRRLQEIFNRLSALASEGKLGEIAPPELTGKQWPMIFNGIFLVSEKALTGFKEQIEALKEETADLEWEMERVGPFPPYNFSQIPRPEEVPS